MNVTDKIIYLCVGLLLAVPGFSHSARAQQASAAAGVNNVMVIPAGRYDAIDASDRFLIQLCRGADECARRREDLKAFARAYQGLSIGFGQIDLATHTEYDAMRKQALAESDAAAARAPAQTGAGQPHVDGDTTITAIPHAQERRGYFDTCPGGGPDAVTYVLKNGGADLIEGIICTAPELERFLKQNADVSASGTVSFATPEAYARAALAQRLEAVTKPSMVTVWTTHAGKRSGVGPGFVVGLDKAGNCEIATASHVTDEELAQFEVTMANGQSYLARKAIDKREREVAIVTALVPADACKPLKIASAQAVAGQQVFMGTMALPEHFDPRAPRWTRGPSDNIGVVTAVQPFAALPGLVSRYQVGQDTVFEGIQGYKADSGTPGVNVDGQVVSMAFVTQEGGGVILAVPARFISEALDELHRQ
jgi:S1-C subfamily serine protease